MRCLPCGTEMRLLGVAPYQAMVKTRELHTFECPNCKRTERRLVLAHIIGSFRSERMQLDSVTPAPVTPAMHKIVVGSRNGWTWMIRAFRHCIFSASVLMEKGLVAARNAWAQAIVAFCPSASAGVAKSADAPVPTSSKYDMVGGLKIVDALRSIVSPKLLALAEEMISGPRRDGILVGAAFALLILAVLLNFVTHDRNVAAVPMGASHVMTGLDTSIFGFLSSSERVRGRRLLTQRGSERVHPSRGWCLTLWLRSIPPIARSQRRSGISW